MKKGKISREDYVSIRKDYEAWCEEERKKHEYRRKREDIDEEIELENWKKHFMEVLEGPTERVVLNIEEEEEQRKEKETGRER